MDNKDLIELALESGAEYYGLRGTGEMLFGTLDFDVQLFAKLIEEFLATKN